MIATPIEHLQQVISEVLMDEWEAQGHKMTGDVVKEIDYQVKFNTNNIILSGLMFPYGSIQAAGITASRIPYGGRTGRGGKSAYISALQDYVKKRMGITDEKKSKSIAFAIATEHKKKGMPTDGSFRFSKNGRRKDWIEFALQSDKVTEAISEMAEGIITANIDVMITNWNIELNK
jgi:hypothetical protein